MFKRYLVGLTCAGAAALLAGTVALASSGRDGARSASGPSLDDQFGVLRQTTSAADALDPVVRLSGVQVDRAKSHRITVSSDRFTAWVVPGSTVLCLAIVGQGGAGASCNANVNAHQGLAMTLGAPTGTLVVGLVPDGVNNVTLKLKSGQTYPLAVRGNTYTADVQGATDAVVYTDTTGSHTQPLPSLSN